VGNNPKVSLILSTYEWPEALALVLSGLMVQTEKSFEVLVADDGSGSATKETLAQYQSRAPFPIRHFWQENKGFRKSRILNRAINEAKGEVCVFLDGDCLPHREYVAQHLALQGPGYYVAGRRVDLSKEFTESLSAAGIERGDLHRMGGKIFRLWLDSLRKSGSRPFHRAYLVKNPLLRSLFGMNRVDDLKGCNFSVSRANLLAVNGFDESFEGYGREDTDLELRLQHLGLKIRSGKNLCVQYHLWHQPRAFTPVNEDLLAEVKSSKRVRAKKGLSS
jgi:glycosyltransferase involved in cell wall biosynthesis